MGKKTKKKSLCKLSKEDVKERWSELSKLVEGSAFMCEKCLRSARLEENLCKPEKLYRLS